MGSYSMTYGRSMLKDIRLLDRTEVQRVYTDVLQIYGPEMRRAILAQPLPPIACGTVNLTNDLAAAAEYSINAKTIILAEPYAGRPDQIKALAHDLAHHVDEVIPTVGEAAVRERNLLTTGGKLRYRKSQDVWVMNGPWLEDYQGAVLGTDYGASKIRMGEPIAPGRGEVIGGYQNTSEFNSQLREYLYDPQQLGWQYAKSQEAVSYTISVLRGQFAPGMR
jgi:hypothetical protein